MRNNPLALDELLALWPTVRMRAKVGSQDHEFAERIELQAMRRGWEPSPSQLAYMRDLVAKYAPDGIRLDPDFAHLWGGEV